MTLFELSAKKLLRVTLILLVAGCSGLQAQETTPSEEIPGVQELRQQAVELEQAMLIATENEREAVAEQADQVLTQFDRRIEALAENLELRQDEMLVAARRYSSELMQALRNQRQDVNRWLDQIRNNETETWDHVVYSFNRAYESFYEVWEDLEADFGLIE